MVVLIASALASGIAHEVVYNFMFAKVIKNEKKGKKTVSLMKEICQEVAKSVTQLVEYPFAIVTGRIVLASGTEHKYISPC